MPGIGQVSVAVLPLIKCSEEALLVFNTVERWRKQPGLSRKGIEKCIYEASQELNMSVGRAQSIYAQLRPLIAALPTDVITPLLIDRQEETRVATAESTGNQPTRRVQGGMQARVDTQNLLVQAIQAPKFPADSDGEQLQECLMKAIDIAGRMVERNRDVTESAKLNRLLTDAEDTIEKALTALLDLRLPEARDLLRDHVNKQNQRILK